MIAPLIASVDLRALLTIAARVCRDVLESSAIAASKYGFAGQGGNLEYPSFARYGLPYALTDFEGGAILVNRDYKPVGIGVPYALWVDYRAFPQWRIDGDTIARVRAADCWTTTQHRGCYLFDDACAPWGRRKSLRDYLDRLECLSTALSEPATGRLRHDSHDRIET